MIVNFSLLNELFKAFYIQRWNDRVRPMDLIEMDKHSHKMMIAYVLGKYEEAAGNKVNWNKIITHGIFELLRRIEISDIKSTIYSEVRKNAPVFHELNKFVYRELEPKIDSEIIKQELNDFLFVKQDDDLSMQILEAAHIYASFWEFQIIKQANPFGYQNIRIETELLNIINSYSNLIGIQKLVNKHTISNFIDLGGQLRFQMRWAQVPRVPKTAVLGHTLLVAMISYFFVRENSGCSRRLFNAFFGGLFHDLPEAVTRDIISPVKRSSDEFDQMIKDLEIKLAEQEIFPLLEPDWIPEIKFYINNEFENKIVINGKIHDTGISTDDLNDKYNFDEYNPHDGKIIRAADHLAAFLEAWNSLSAGITSEELRSASQNIKDDYKDKSFGKVSIKSLYANFKNL